MYKILSLPSSRITLDALSPYGGEQGFLDKFFLDGYEVIQAEKSDPLLFSSNATIGVHLSYFPAWLDFYLQSACLKQGFPDDNCLNYYYGSTDPHILVENMRREMLEAMKLGVKYVVLHVSHCSLEESYNFNFKYSDEEIVDNFAKLVNEAMQGLDPDFYLLFENLWWPGLTFLRPKIASRLLEKVEYSKAGFMLDTAHLMNTNPKLLDEEEAIAYCKEKITDLGELREKIYGVHLNLSLSGEYRKNIPTEGKILRPKDFAEFKEGYLQIYSHISMIDRHQAFSSPQIAKLIDWLQPEFLVHELRTLSIETLVQDLTTQVKALEIK